MLPWIPYAVYPCADREKHYTHNYYSIEKLADTTAVTFLSRALVSFIP